MIQCSDFKELVGIIYRSLKHFVKSFCITCMTCMIHFDALPDLRWRKVGCQHMAVYGTLIWHIHERTIHIALYSRWLHYVPAAFATQECKYLIIWCASVDLCHKQEYMIASFRLQNYVGEAVLHFNLWSQWSLLSVEKFIQPSKHNTVMVLSSTVQERVKNNSIKRCGWTQVCSYC